MAAGYLRFLVFRLILAAVFIVPKGPREDQLGFVQKILKSFYFIPEVSSTLWALMGILPTEVNLLNVILGLYP